MEEQVAVIIFIHMYGYLQTQGTTFLPCYERRLNCCAGYVFEENKAKCIKCPVGFRGPMCQTPCRFPLYGQFCQTRCNCERSECSHIEGCYLANRNDFVTQRYAVPKEEASVNLNQDLGSRVSMIVSTTENRAVHDSDYPPSSTCMYMPTIDDSWASSFRMSIFILVGLCILLMILYAASYGIKLRKTEHEPNLIHLEARDNYSL